MATVSIYLDKRSFKKKTGTYPVKLQVITDSKPYRYQTVFSLTEEDYKKLSASRINETLVKVRESLKQITKTAEDYIECNAAFDLSQFEKHFIKNNPLFLQRKRKPKGATEVAVPSTFDLTIFEKKFQRILEEKHPSEEHISSVYYSYIITLLEQNRVGNALSFQQSYCSLKKFSGNVRFEEITVNYLVRYEHWMLNQGRSKTTVGINLRPLRAVFNEAIDKRIIKRESCYPFGRRRYQIPTGRKIKKALKMEEVGKLYYFEPRCIEERKAKAYWFFCYFGNGMNPMDLAHMKYKNIEGDYLIFERFKTQRSTRQDPQIITAFINDEMKEIIDSFGNEDRNPNNYIFPILRHGLDVVQQYNAGREVTRFINNWMDEIRRGAGIEKKVRNNEARHSYATQMKRSGANTEFIQEALGHTNPRTTQNYLDSFENDIKREFSGKLSAFKSNRPLEI